ncbi:ABC transporter ATP-binding protein [Mycoplasmopsis agassizii]|uniref:ABC transporter ATP-binding protein n=1 Tax=Mycoplasmopsis agassizii TaxID=33922 RepID=UPI0009D8C5A5|nr:ABC transporter ATP-binding protein [Mycoplasmopsis agassizii]SMC17893.1 simple sugar transport system ATP-binding protein [Mycoplasmopsis agassizii]
MSQEYAIEFKNITKEFPGIKANDNISFGIKKGTIHALIGENGAGKSTLMSILFGLYKPTSGEILINNTPTVIKGPNHANEMAISMVHQHFKIVDDYTNLENIILGNESVKGGFLDKSFPTEKIKLIQDRYNLHFDLKQKTGKATVATQQKVEIMKMLYRDANILIFDEPTAVLTPQEIEGFLETLKGFREKGKTVIFISHKLDEVIEVSDRATIIRHGKVIKTYETLKGVSISQMSADMVGETIVMPKNTSSQDFTKNDVIVKFDKVSAHGEKSLKDVSFDIKAGEILAIAGVEGNGQVELELAVSGLLKIDSGSIYLKPYVAKGYSKSDSEVAAKKTLQFENSNFQKRVRKVKSKIHKTFYATSVVFGESANYLKTIFKKENKHQLVWGNDFGRWLKESLKTEVDTSSKNENHLDISDKSVQSRIKYGISYIPGDRHKYGLVLDFNIRDNAILRRLKDKKVSHFGFINKQVTNNYNLEIEETFDVRGSRKGESMARSLSGGNQQKAIVGREILNDHQFIIIVQPTRGLDVGAINNIHQHILEEKKKNRAILLISYELDEVLALADNVAVLHSGKLSKKIPISKTNRTEIGLMMAGVKNEQSQK